MASPGFSPISEDGEVGEAPQEGTPSLPPSAFAAVAAAAAALSAPALPISEGSVAAPAAATESGLAGGDQALDTAPFESGGAPWGASGSVLLLPPTVTTSRGLQQSESAEFEAPHESRRSSDSYSMEIEPSTPMSSSTSSAPRPNHQGSAVASTVASPFHPGDAADGASAGMVAPAAASTAGAGMTGPWQQHQQQQQQPPPQQHQQPHQHPHQRALAGLAAGFSTERIVAVLATVDSRQASVETAANLIYRFAAAVPPPHVAVAAVEAATHAAGAAAREAAATAGSSSGVPLSPIALRALTRTAGAKAAAAAAAAAGALPLSICYIMLDAYRRSEPKHRLAIFYVFHRLMHLSSAARGNAESQIPPGSIEDAGYSVFVLPVVQELSHAEMDSVRHKMLRCISIWRDWRVYTPTALRHIRQLAAKGVSNRTLERGEVAAAEAWAALLQLQTLRFLAQTPSGRKAYAYARHCLSQMSREVLPIVGPESPGEAAEAAVSSTTDSHSEDKVATGSTSSSCAEESEAKRRKCSVEGKPGAEAFTPSQTQGEGETDQIDFVNNDCNIAALRLLSDEQLATCSKLFDRASRVTGQEYLLLQSSLMDLSGLLQMQHQRLLELREEMQQFSTAKAAVETAEDFASAAAD
ncbi:hypothetical protein Emed_000374 [Eimeria media]